MIRGTNIGASKALFFKTKRGAQWLIDNVRECLNSYSIEFKVTGSTIVLRVSQTHSRIAYYQCFGLHFRKVAMRNMYGIKLSNVLYTTRKFGRKKAGGQTLMYTDEDDEPKVEVVRAALIERIKTYLEDKEKGKHEIHEIGPGERVETESSSEPTGYEFVSDPQMPIEMIGSIRLPAELDDSSVPLFGKKKRLESPPEDVFELPA